MVRLLVRKSLLSAWTSSRSYGRRRTGRCAHRRPAVTDTGALTARPRHIRLDVLFCSCCYCADDTSCCSCCVTDEECQGNLPATSSFSSVLLLRQCSNVMTRPSVMAAMFCTCQHLSPCLSCWIFLMVIII